jgi:thioredoxin 1
VKISTSPSYAKVCVRWATPTLVLIFAISAHAQTSSKRTQFQPLELWRAAVLSDSGFTLQQLYSGAHIEDSSQHPISNQEELQFWHKLKTDGLSGLAVDIAKVEPGPSSSEVVSFETTMKMRTLGGYKSEYLILSQVWSGGANPKILAERRGDLRRLKQPLHLDPKLYDPAANAHTDIQQALARAGRERKRVLLVFGGNWCYDCHVLEAAFHDPAIKPVLDRNYILVHVDVGEYNKNLDVAQKYAVPLDKGVPALVVLSSDGSVVFNQPAGLTAARSLSPEDILLFLNKWKPAT